MTYAELSVIIDGALESEETFTDQALMDHYIGQVKLDAVNDGVYAEIYVIFHDHGRREECECMQYLTDHHPYATGGKER